MTIKEIVKKYLEENGFDGLYREDCGCFLNDFMPCSEGLIDCMAGYRMKAPRDTEFPVDFFVGPKKEG